ncbi:hypothetical protein MVEN_01780500 [Mycena venus]|uniref:Uncharacterized protein n=1 Tax=Mycena venus TaxID=2733690 RepID=A0A8H6XN80_9AGAR|nr:hypothetical protein MVEN_01780500 [Mycena venus]
MEFIEFDATIPEATAPQKALTLSGGSADRTALDRLPRGALGIPRICFSSDEIVLVQDDMDESDFAVDKQDRVCMFDFGDVTLLPDSLSNYTMVLNRPFIVAVAGYLQWPRSGNQNSILEAQRMLQYIPEKTLGMFFFPASCTALVDNGKVLTRIDTLEL